MFIENIIPPCAILDGFRAPFVVVLLEIDMEFPNGLNSYTKLCVAGTLFGILFVFFDAVSRGYQYFPT